MIKKKEKSMVLLVIIQSFASQSAAFHSHPIGKSANQMNDNKKKKLVFFTQHEGDDKIVNDTRNTGSDLFYYNYKKNKEIFLG